MLCWMVFLGASGALGSLGSLGSCGPLGSVVPRIPHDVNVNLKRKREQHPRPFGDPWHNATDYSAINNRKLYQFGETCN